MSETMNTKKDIYILGIESSCDETAASQVLNQNPHIPGQPLSLQAQRAQDKSF